MGSFISLLVKASTLFMFVSLSQSALAEDYRNYGGGYQDFGGGSSNSAWSSLPSGPSGWEKISEPSSNSSVGETSETPPTHINNGKRDTIPTKKCDGCRSIEK